MAPFTFSATLFSAVVGVHAAPRSLSTQFEVAADFSDSDGYMKGEVFFEDSGKWDYDLTITDVSGLEDTLLSMDRECKLKDEDLKFHIHTFWNHDDDKSFGVGTECDADYTGGHYKTLEDPTEAVIETCAALCEGDKCTRSETRRCEIGDLSGKGGAATPSLEQYRRNKIAYSGRYSQDRSITNDVRGDIIGRSVVFHCGSTGARIFCARIDMD